jgi:hypothetical protein
MFPPLKVQAVRATDWATISSLATAVGTLVLAIATFSSVRSANRAARTAERAFQVGLRPVLFPSNPEDRSQKIGWGDNHWATVQGGRADIEEVDGNIYMAISLRNVGVGIAVLHGWRVAPQEPGQLALSGREAGMLTRPDTAEFRPQVRDLYVPPGDVSFWQGAIREPDYPARGAILAAIQERQSLFVDLLYGDHEGGQRTISRFRLVPRQGQGTDWLSSVVRHWYLDRQDPR